MIIWKQKKIKIIERLRKLQKDDDTEDAHKEADKILCEMLIKLGFEDVVKEYNEVGKWYA
jgi:hypothetical protein